MCTIEAVQIDVTVAFMCIALSLGHYHDGALRELSCDILANPVPDQFNRP
ncbi:hypothetical protein [Marinobacter sp. F4216]|nr:hypothetical protein [Marinobacter sp. F4216]MBZ2168548.1 hypothetical protein [Marinobacter sp. F4216]